MRVNESRVMSTCGRSGSIFPWLSSTLSLARYQCLLGLVTLCFHCFLEGGSIPDWVVLWVGGILCSVLFVSLSPSRSYCFNHHRLVMCFETSVYDGFSFVLSWDYFDCLNSFVVSHELQDTFFPLLLKQIRILIEIHFVCGLLWLQWLFLLILSPSMYE